MEEDNVRAQCYCTLLTRQQLSYNIIYTLKDFLKPEFTDEATQQIEKLLNSMEAK